MIRRKLSKEIIKKEEYQIWNSFIDLIAMENENELTEIQKNAQQAFWYDSELQNGGHLQYFENQKKKDYSNVIQSLKNIGAEKQSQILQKAANLYFNKNRKSIKSIFNFIKKANEGEFDEFDSQYYEIEPDMNYHLQNYLNNNLNEFIEIE